MIKRRAYMLPHGLLLLTGLCLLIGARAQAAERPRVEGIIVKYKESTSRIELADRQRDILHLAEGALRHARRKTGSKTDIYYLDRPRSAAEARQIARELMRRDDVEYAEPDYRRYPADAPDDTFYAQQWYLKPSTTEPGSINAEQAWEITAGSASIVIAVIDTGILQHPDIGSNRVLPGYDFITSAADANDGDGRDPDPTDAGDFVTAGESSSECEESDSSWHGTRVAGLLIAQSDNMEGIAGLDHQASLLPLRALGKCGGVASDIADAIRWAAGLPVGNPDVINPNPAHVINLSIGGDEPCTNTEQEAINAAVNAGVVVVASAGNEGLSSLSSPANCDNVIAVAATTRQGAETCYTNVSPDVDLSAPGGNDNDGDCNGGLGDGIITTSNSGVTTAGISNYDFGVGTSFAAPLVSGVIGLVKAVDNELSPDAIESILKISARAFPENTNDGFRDCQTSRCGAGLLDALGAVSMAVTGIDAIPDPFGFEDRSGVDRNTLVISNSVTITGISIPMPVRISGGEYSIEGGPFTGSEEVISAGQSIRLRLRSSGQYNTETRATLSIGGVSDNYTIRTRKNSGGGGAAVWLPPLLIAWRLAANRGERRGKNR